MEDGQFFVLLFIIVVALILLGILAAKNKKRPGDPPGDPPASQAQQKVISQGHFEVFNTDLCAYLPTCFGQNPDSPYARLIFPAPSGLNRAQREVAALGGFRMNPNQYVMISGHSPPECRYFGFTAYLFSRADESVPFASLGDTLNLTDIPFDSDFSIVVSGSHAITQDIMQNNPSVHPLILSIPMADTVKPDDTLMIVMRTAYFKDQDAGNAYLENLPVTGALIESSVAPDLLYYRNKLIPRPTDPSEQGYQGSFEAYTSSQLAKLANLGLAQTLKVDYHPFFKSINYNSGYDCLDQRVQCLADNRDATYSLIEPIDLGIKQAIIVMGVNHVSTGKAIYVSQSLYDYNKQFGLASFSDKDIPEAAQFYTFLFSRAEVPGLDVPTYLIPEATQMISMAERTYIQPGSKVSPSSDSLILPVAYIVNLP